MTGGTLIIRNLCHYRRTNLGVMLGVAVSTAILTGALLVGDSVDFSLRKLSQIRLGKTQLALVGQNRFFRSRLADDLNDSLSVDTAAVLQLRGILINNNTNVRSNRVEVLGVDERFWELGTGDNPFTKTNNNIVGNMEGMILSEQLAQRLGVQQGDELLLRVSKPSVLPRDAPLSLDRDLAESARLIVRDIVGDDALGRFNLRTNQTAPMNAFVPRGWLAEKVGLTGKANLLLIGDNKQISVETANAALSSIWQIEDAGLELRGLPEQGVWELRSKRIFMEEAISKTAGESDPAAQGIFTYFVNELRYGQRSTPYSIVSALAPQEGGLIEPVMSDDEIVINTWLAEDLQAKKGDTIKLIYFVIGTMRQFEERVSSFKVRKVVPMEGAAADRELMPAFEGLAESENCRDWEPGVNIDLSRIRDKDEAYWQQYRGTPKAFVTLNAGQKLWGNRIGKLTAVRYPQSSMSHQEIRELLKEKLNPAEVGLFFQPVSQRGRMAAAQAIDLGGLFLSMSFFLIMAALGLTGLLFVFGIEQRHGEIATLQAVGYTRRQVRWLLLLEGIILAGLGAIAGTGGSVIYTKAMIYGLSTVWASAAGGSIIFFHAEKATLPAGMGAGIVMAILAIWITLWRQKHLKICELLYGVFNTNIIRPSLFLKSKVVRILPEAAFIVAILLILDSEISGSSGTGVFFGAGMLMLGACLAGFYRYFLQKAVQVSKTHLTFPGLASRNTARRRGRSLTVVGLLACGSFLVFAVGANRHDPLAGAQRRDGGTGGFTLMGESTLPVLHNINKQSGRDALGIDESVMTGVKVVHLRVRDGDDASCLNLNRAQQPRILGVDPNEFSQRGAFGFAKTPAGATKESPWDVLTNIEEPAIVPAITDYNTIIWALGKKPGDTLDYMDERGENFKIRLVAAMQNSILQGSLVISEDEFVTLFPSEQGYRMLLIDAPMERQKVISQSLTRAGRDIGLEITPATQRLAELFAVENTYLSIFQLLGGLGMTLGSVGLALVVLRNVMERRAELAMLRAVGFDKEKLVKLILYEHWGLLVMGLVSGVVCALIAVIPTIREGGREIPYLGLGLTMAALFLSGVLWIWLAGRFSLRGSLLAALRNE